MADSEPIQIWKSPNPESTPIAKYRQHVNTKFGLSLQNTHQLHEWSISNPHDLWIDLYGYLQVVPSLPQSITKAYDDTLRMKDIPEFFKGHEINYTEVVWSRNHNRSKEKALIEIREGWGLEGKELTWEDLWERVWIVRSALLRSGIKKEDRVAALVANSIWAVVLFLATASIGAIFTSISPDLGTEGCVSRLKQVTPSILFADGDSTYKGHRASIIPKITSILEQLASQPQVFIIPVSEPISHYPPLSSFLSRASPTDTLSFTRVPFNAPLLICYSSGTTGAPKCIVHSHSIILQLLKVQSIHDGLGPGDVVMQFTSTTWIVFYVLNGHLAAGATCICYDGSPMYPDIRFMPRLLEKYKCAMFGTSPRYLLELASSGCVPKQEFNLSYLRQISTTGAPLTAELYGWVYKSFPSGVLIANQAGGTDTGTSLLAADQAGVLNVGEMQVPGLGMSIDILDPASGESVKESGGEGEMVITKPFPSMPCFLWGDSVNAIYRKEYFSKWDGKKDVWAVSDWLSYNPKTKGWKMTGRSDTVLNPSGIRFGSGEIYAVAEAPPFTTERGIAETLCVGRRRPNDVDEAVFLFVRMQPGRAFAGELRDSLKDAIAKALSRRHVPKFVEEVKELPVTVNGKKVEVAVKNLISGRDVKVSSTVVNPGALEEYRKFRDLEFEPRKSRL
ncbi:MAG: hypothetical protein M1820_007951 [Bogoriella megaspora]|nr:MAG: hypothetical protein M1820_007951 [Bogoriella megaspora]